MHTSLAKVLLSRPRSGKFSGVGRLRRYTEEGKLAPQWRERGVAGVPGVDGVSRSLPVSESSDNSSDWSGEGMISSGRAPVRNCGGDSYSSSDEAKCSEEVSSRDAIEKDQCI